MRKPIEFDFSKWGQEGISVEINGIKMATLHKNPFLPNSYYGIQEGSNGEEVMWCKSSSGNIIKMYQEVKPLEIWVNEFTNTLNMHRTPQSAALSAKGEGYIRTVRLVEVIEE